MDSCSGLTSTSPCCGFLVETRDEALPPVHLKSESMKCPDRSTGKRKRGHGWTHVKQNGLNAEPKQKWVPKQQLSHEGVNTPLRKELPSDALPVGKSVSDRTVRRGPVIPFKTLLEACLEEKLRQPQFSDGPLSGLGVTSSVSASEISATTYSGEWDFSLFDRFSSDIYEGPSRSYDVYDDICWGILDLYISHEYFSTDYSIRECKKMMDAFCCIFKSNNLRPLYLAQNLEFLYFSYPDMLSVYAYYLYLKSLLCEEGSEQFLKLRFGVEFIFDLFERRSLQLVYSEFVLAGLKRRVNETWEKFSRQK